MTDLFIHTPNSNGNLKNNSFNNLSHGIEQHV